MHLVRAPRARPRGREDAGGKQPIDRRAGGRLLRLTLVRHGSTPWNEAGRYQGWGDPPLSERGRAQALRLRARLEGEAFDRV
ncbi:MAG: histidine phosphatase family protein, partial [Gemmatimonadetes bacterium]|nr:histidine phosphatase family protein [Gemmatimonadota bacterium]